MCDAEETGSLPEENFRLVFSCVIGKFESPALGLQPIPGLPTPPSPPLPFASPPSPTLQSLLGVGASPLPCIRTASQTRPTRLRHCVGHVFISLDGENFSDLATLVALPEWHDMEAQVPSDGGAGEGCRSFSTLWCRSSPSGPAMVATFSPTAAESLEPAALGSGADFACFGALGTEALGSEVDFFGFGFRLLLAFARSSIETSIRASRRSASAWCLLSIFGFGA